MQDLLEFQKVDTIIRKNNRIIESCDEKKEMSAYKAKFDEAKKNMLVAEANADKLVAAYNNALAYLDKVTAELDKLVKTLETAENKEEVIAKLQDMKAKVSDANNKVKTMMVRADEALKLYVKANNEGKSSKENYNKAKETYDKKVAVPLKQNEELKPKVEALRKKVDPKLLSEYDALVAQNIIPPFVQVHGDEKEYRCGGCNMGLFGAARDTLRNNGRCICDVCKRIIYKG